jgi:hypothetical protein
MLEGLLRLLATVLGAWHGTAYRLTVQPLETSDILHMYPEF